MNQNTFVAFLRGVMPSGRNAVKMADVRAVLSDHGFNDVRTWIQSGNIILNTSLTAEAASRSACDHQDADTASGGTGGQSVHRGSIRYPAGILCPVQLATVRHRRPAAARPWQRVSVHPATLCLHVHPRKCCTQPAGQCVSGKEAWTDADHPQRQHAAENGFLLSIASFSSTVTTHACSWRALTQEVRTGKALR